MIGVIQVKNRILTFIIGVLTGAIIMALVFLIFNKPTENINNGNFPPNNNGQIWNPNGNMGERPEKPRGDVQIPTR